VREKIFWIFGVINLAAIVAVGVFVVPTAQSFHAGRERLRFFERMYAAAYEHTGDTDATVSNFYEIIPALSLASSRGAMHGLETHEFFAGEFFQTAQISPEEYFLEVRVTAEYEGDFHDAIALLREFQDTRSYIRSFTIKKNEVAQVRMQFSIFGPS